ncbi:germ cell-less protein-like 1 [Caerostris extrusa]|uniref:Germ cell-less protein-like 1 n=1 Tax=Caerostris extrusa TaxID=172846 RepID=A0AAV4WZU6_CAEEX|nr:germ cell-less protein-like 1 [Caerostris extrusa]
MLLTFINLFFVVSEGPSGTPTSDDALGQHHELVREKIMSTTKYVYKTLFLEEQGSDIKIVALNRTWNLHRLYLSQSPYFNSMFNGIWLETNQKEIHIGIEDENITACALHKVFGSFYQDEIHINPLEAVSILACATLLQLDDIIFSVLKL